MLIEKKYFLLFSDLILFQFFECAVHPRSLHTDQRMPDPEKAIE